MEWFSKPSNGWWVHAVVSAFVGMVAIAVPDLAKSAPVDANTHALLQVLANGFVSWLRNLEGSA